MSDQSAPERIWPDKLRIRDTGIIHEDEGGRIYTTVGRGYEKRVYVLEEIVDRRIAEARAVALRAAATGVRFLSPFSLSSYPRLAYEEALQAAEAYIRTLIDADAQAALDRKRSATSRSLAQRLASKARRWLASKNADGSSGSRHRQTTRPLPSPPRAIIGA